MGRFQKRLSILITALKAKLVLCIGIATWCILIGETPVFAAYNPWDHSGDASYEDTNQDWNGDGEKDGVDHNGDPYGDKLLTWRTGTHTSGSFSVDEGYTLTIEPGAIVKFRSSQHALDVLGTLIADGTPTDKIVFTSIKDDSYGGDTNNDGDETSPAPYEWSRVSFRGGSVNCILDNCVVQYGGYQGQVVYCQDSNPTISNNLIQFTSECGIECSNSSATISGNTISDHSNYGIYCSGSSNPTISDNTITNSGYPIYLALDCFPIITGSSFSNNSYNGVGIVGGDMKKSGTWRTINYPYIFTGSVMVDSGVTLTIEPGAIVKFRSSQHALDVLGTLIADGTPTDKIVFTSIKDDSYGGDTNNDGDETSPALNDWSRISFRSGSVNCILDNCVVQYGGYQGQVVYCQDSNPTISNNLIQFNWKCGIECSNSSATIRGNTISDHFNYSIYCHDSSNPTISDNTITENRYGIYSASSSNPVINNNSIYGNTDYGVYNADGSLTINAENNWWGDASGPCDPTDGSPDYNPDGKGDKVSDYVTYRPWSTKIVMCVEEDTTTFTGVPEVFSLLQNYPNPFNPSTEIRFDLPENSHITLMVFNALGQKVATLVNEKREAGSYQVVFNGTAFPTGIYLYRLETGGFNKTMKMLLIK